MKMIRKPSSQDGWYEITPSDAQKFLDEKGPNRPLTESKAVSTAEEIKSGCFAENGESIIFDENGRLLDGQHRMRAIVLANKPIVSLCVFGIPRRHFVTIDGGRKRTAADALATKEYKNAVISASVARQLFIYKNVSGSIAPGSAIPKISNKDILDTMKKNPDIEDAVSFVLSLPALRKIISPSTTAFCYLMASRQNATKAEEFFSKLASGEQLKTGSPILTLRNRLVGLVGEKHKITTVELVAITIKAWNAFIAGRQMKLARWYGKTKNESFPRFGEDIE
jgi:hypothetical protein